MLPTLLVQLVGTFHFCQRASHPMDNVQLQLARRELSTKAVSWQTPASELVRRLNTCKKLMRDDVRTQNVP